KPRFAQRTAATALLKKTHYATPDSIMADSLRDQLLKSGIVKQFKDEKRPQQPISKPNASFPKNKPPQKSKPTRSGGEFDLAKAYAIRAQTEAQERKRA